MRKTPPKALSPSSAGKRAPTTWMGSPESPPLPELPHDILTLIEKLEGKLCSEDGFPPELSLEDDDDTQEVMRALGKLKMSPEDAEASLRLAGTTSLQVLKWALTIRIVLQLE